MITIIPAEKKHCEDLVRLVMMAMTEPCCLYYAGKGRTLADFARVMRVLVSEERSQYSYTNATVATDEHEHVMGACVAYDGALLHELRESFFRTMREEIGRTFKAFDDETTAGEYYIDSLAVYPHHRRNGVAKALLTAAIEKAHAMGMPAGLLVDKGNPGAEHLYSSVGFHFVNDSHWGGHPMKHMQTRFRVSE